MPQPASAPVASVASTAAVAIAALMSLVVIIVTTSCRRRPKAAADGLDAPAGRPVA